ncbi:hypothetical protein BABINDRAFT_33657 [Babjeviella inositovora NRRL Y-12698]|uniref:Mitochondrial oxaloacetate transport protein n=1 Tax=Babjeviella inositovora NRRL Y-12698 TaxID=984486 RepID=A0A1E3QU80_9ASCO|nr:uncharacterized protein BABINDRAFT_33657 [Babjeviella inositovora NRRL Y-12698]ODQ81229.1 hypothetical protein BABINDRAFT_33657 [Babjeviella inositovora NRRL Y-12698]
MTTSTHKKTAAQDISTLGGFMAGGVASCLAVTFTNPIEIVKTRLQLQGEMAAKDASVPRPYKNTFQALGAIYKNEGARALQKGLGCAYVYQIGLNGCRLGLYEPVRVNLNKLFYADQDPYKVQNVSINVFTGAVTGMAGAVAGNPFFLIKTRMQSYSTAIQVGQQTHYSSSWAGLRTILRIEGVRGLYRGVDAAMLRTGAGSSVQLPAYNMAKGFAQRHDLISEGPALHLLSSTFAGIGVGLAMNPWDVILTRLYNQKGNFYSGPIDCFQKTVRSEGVMALYKGLGAQLLRIAPQTVLTLTFMEQTMKAAHYFENEVLPIQKLAA